MTSLRERKKVACRAALQRAALELTLEHDSIDTVTVDAIAARAGISPRTFFNYYPTKESALFKAYIGRREELAQEILDWPGDDAPARVITEVLLRNALAADAEIAVMLKKVLAQHPDLVGQSMVSAIAINRAISEAAYERADVTDLETRLRLGQLTTALSSVLRVTIGFHWYHDRRPEDLPGALRDAAERTLAGLG